MVRKLLLYGSFACAADVDPAVEPRCVSWDDYENCEPASILAEIKRTAVEIEP